MCVRVALVPGSPACCYWDSHSRARISGVLLLGFAPTRARLGRAAIGIHTSPSYLSLPHTHTPGSVCARPGRFGSRGFARVPRRAAVGICTHACVSRACSYWDLHPRAAILICTQGLRAWRPCALDRRCHCDLHSGKVLLRIRNGAAVEIHRQRVDSAFGMAPRL